MTQLRLGCGGDLNRTQEVQRSFADEYEAMSVGCRRPRPTGTTAVTTRTRRGTGSWAIGTRHIYGDVPDEDVDAPNPESARFSADRSEVIVQMRNAESVLSYEDGAHQDFLFEGSSATLSGGRVEGSQLILTVSGDTTGASALHYRGRSGPGQWVTNERGIGLLTFHGLPLE